MRATLRADSMRGAAAPPGEFPAAFPWPVAFFAAVCMLLVAVVYLCASLARVIAPAAGAFPSAPAEHSPLARAAAVEHGASDITGVDVSLEVPSDAALADAILGALARYPEHASVAVLNLDDGRWATYDADRVRYAASTFKLAVLYEVERRVSAGELAYDDRIVLTEEAVAEDLGTLERVPVAEDGTVSVEEALDAMITLSDNATAVALLRHVGPGAIDETLRDIGLTTMSVNTKDLPATAADLALLMRAIVAGEGVADAQREHMRDLLLGQTIRSGIPAAVAAESRAGLAVGNKTGTWPGITNDVAFVESAAGTYVIAVTAEGDWNWALVSDVSRAVYDTMTAR
jgi:beta-lactamase class A